MTNRILGGALFGLVAIGFAWLNGGQRISLHLGLFRLDSVSVTAVVFGAFLAGMVTLFLASLRADLKTQRMLRRYREELGREASASPADSTESS